MLPLWLITVDISGTIWLIIHFLGLDAVTFEPSFDVPMVNVTVKEGVTAILPCSVKFLGEHQVVWTDQWSTLLTFEDRRIIDDERLSVERPYTTDWNLHIRAVSHNDQGIYNCQVNTSPVKIKTVNLNVQVPSKIIDTLSSNDVTAREGDTVTLICNVTGVPMPTVTWNRHKNLGKEVEKESEFCPGTDRIGVSGEVLVIHNVSRVCGGEFECVAFNGVPPPVSRNINVAVEYPPEIRLPNKRLGQFTGRETILECMVTAYPQEISVWMREGVQITNSFKYRVTIYENGGDSMILSLRIRNLDFRDFGEYTCKASNRLGQDHETMTLYDYTPYKKPTTILPTTTPMTFHDVTTIRRKYIRTFPPETAKDHRDSVILLPDTRPTQREQDRRQYPQGASGQTLETKNGSRGCYSIIDLTVVVVAVLTILHSQFICAL